MPNDLERFATENDLSNAKLANLLDMNRQEIGRLRRKAKLARYLQWAVVGLESEFYQIPLFYDDKPLDRYAIIMERFRK